jgi:hypothetical protein
MVSSSVLERLTVAQIYELAVPHGTIQRHGRGATVRCPVLSHEDRHPSCSLDEVKNRWRCFGCGARGLMLDIVIVAGHAPDRAAAARWLEERIR